MTPQAQTLSVMLVVTFYSLIQTKRSESLGLENKLDCFWDLESIAIFR